MRKLRACEMRDERNRASRNERIAFALLKIRALSSFDKLCTSSGRNCRAAAKRFFQSRKIRRRKLNTVKRRSRKKRKKRKKKEKEGKRIQYRA